MSADWEEGMKIAGGGFGITILVLLILAIITWLVGLISQRVAARREKGGETGEGEV